MVNVVETSTILGPVTIHTILDTVSITYGAPPGSSDHLMHHFECRASRKMIKVSDDPECHNEIQERKIYGVKKVLRNMDLDGELQRHLL